MIASGTPIASMENLGMLVRKVNLQSPSLKTIDVNGGLFQNAGSTLTEELAFTLAMANDYLAHLTDRGIDPVVIQQSMRLSFTSGPNYFLEIAKLRAARILWSLLTEAYGMKHTDSSIDIHATTARWNQTLYDPYVNMLRGTSEAMAAVIGGADYLTVLPFNIASGKSTALADRIARNVPIILREEGYLDKVADPSAGSYYLEKLTHELGARSWGLFQEVEARGGFRKASESGWIQQQVLHSAKGKQQQISNGAKKLIGTNAFPNPNETISLKTKKVNPQQPEDAPLDHLHPFRPSSTLEEIRLKVEQLMPRPRAFLLKIGNPNWAISRAAFASSFFASGGYEILDPPLFISTRDAVSEVLKSHPEIIVLCGSDEDVVEKAAEIISSLPPSTFIVVAGDPRNIGKNLEAHGISQFIHRRSSLVETLQVINSIILK
jgi:methylmalonyl-CoA mutase